MKTFSMKRSLMLVAALVCMIAAGSVSALAVPKAQTFISFEAKTFTGKCCFLMGDTVKVNEPATVAPVIVTWSTEYRTGNEFIVGLSVNNGPCIAHGPRDMQPLDDVIQQKTFQWVLFPNDGLRSGTNTLTVCGGGALNDTDSILVGLRTLTVQIGK